ncbi:MAG TPA: endolytic transglycosylase MltG [Arthrobacter sp.]|nr:endolytic transglycosylase MltG [Arthrobacter sp.]
MSSLYHGHTPTDHPDEVSEPYEFHYEYNEEHVPLSSRRSQRPARERRRRRRRRTIVMTLALALFSAVVIFAVSVVAPFFAGGEDPMADYPGPGTGSVTVKVEQGAPTIGIAQNLVNSGVVASTGAFMEALRADDSGNLIQPGTYEMKEKMAAEDAVAALLNTDQTAVHYAAVDQGLRQPAVFRVLSESSGIPVEEFEQLAKDPTQFGIPEQAPSLEGYLSPGQYRFPLDATAKEIINMLVDKTFANLEKAGVEGKDNQYRVLTIASIIEHEGNPESYEEIAGAIQNRLQEPIKEIGRFIQSDATVTYGLERKSYQLTAKEKNDKSNPYNTYANPGLPIGPIGSPLLPAIKAAADPPDNPYYYWVTVNLDTGKTLFAERHAGHVQNVNKFQQWCADNPGRCQ